MYKMCVSFSHTVSDQRHATSKKIKKTICYDSYKIEKVSYVFLSYLQSFREKISFMHVLIGLLTAPFFAFTLRNLRRFVYQLDWLLSMSNNYLRYAICGGYFYKHISKQK